jgi:hypothetical protein
MKLVIRALGALLLSLALPAATLAAVPENDLPPGIVVTALPFTHSTDTEDAEIHAMEPNSTCVLLGSNSVWYTYTATADVDLVVDTLGSDFDTVIDVFHGTLSANPDDPFDALTVVGCNDNDGASVQSRLAFSASSGETYLIRVNNPLDGNGGALTLNLAVASAAEPSVAPPSQPPTDGVGSSARPGSGPSGAFVALVAGLLAFGLVFALPARRSMEARRAR